MRETLEKSLRQKTSVTTGKGLVRAGEILDATRHLFVMEGFGKLSMRGVAARVGVTLGTVQHYYKTKEELLDAMLMGTLAELQAKADQLTAAQPGASPGARFRAAMRYFIKEMLDPLLRGMFVELNAIAMRDHFAAGILEKVLLRARKSVGRRVRELVPRVREKDLHIRSALIVTQLMGLTFYDHASVHRRPADLDAIHAASLDLMLAIALGKPERRPGHTVIVTPPSTTTS